jgi:hypothetical protein
MTRRSSVLLATLAALAYGGGTAAQPPTAEVPQPPGAAAPEQPARLYQVEVLIFANRDFDPAEEHFEHEMPVTLPHDLTLRDPPVFDDTAFALPFDEPASGLLENAPSPADAASPPVAAAPPPADAPAAALEPPAEEPFRTRVLQPNELQLAAPARSLGRLPAYRVLVHGGWIQEGLPENQTEAFDLGRLGVINPSGVVRVYASRFLHVVLDLTYQGAALPAVPVTGGGVDDLAEIRLAPRYRLDAERQVRSGELHFFDHPAFGVLVKVTPVAAGTSGGATRPAA